MPIPFTSRTSPTLEANFRTEADPLVVTQTDHSITQATEMVTWWPSTRISTSTTTTSIPIPTPPPLASTILKMRAALLTKTTWWTTHRQGLCRTCRTIGQRCWTEALLAQTTIKSSKTTSCCQKQVQIQVVWLRRSIIASSLLQEWAARQDRHRAEWAVYPQTSTTTLIIAATVRSVRFREWRCIYERTTVSITAASDILKTLLITII